jgi:hypothetical protein
LTSPQSATLVPLQGTPNERELEDCCGEICKTQLKMSKEISYKSATPMKLNNDKMLGNKNKYNIISSVSFRRSGEIEGQQ